MHVITEELIHAVSLVNDPATLEIFKANDPEKLATKWEQLAVWISDDCINGVLREEDFALLRTGLIKMLAIVAKLTENTPSEIYIWKGKTNPGENGEKIDYYFEKELGEYLMEKYPPREARYMETVCQSVAFSMANFFTLSSVIGPFTDELKRELASLSK